VAIQNPDASGNSFMPSDFWLCSAAWPPATSEQDFIRNYCLMWIEFYRKATEARGAMLAYLK
jgi:hypothetical protein